MFSIWYFKHSTADFQVKSQLLVCISKMSTEDLLVFSSDLPVSVLKQLYSSFFHMPQLASWPLRNTLLSYLLTFYTTQLLTVQPWQDSSYLDVYCSWIDITSVVFCSVMLSYVCVSSRMRQTGRWSMSHSIFLNA